MIGAAGPKGWRVRFGVPRQHGVVLAAALVAVLSVALSAAPSTTAAAEAPTAPAAAVVSDVARPDLATPMRSLVALAADRVPNVSPAAPRYGRDIPMACPTTEEPGCALWFIRGDAAWRIHPVYGYRSCHTGIDLRGTYGSPIHAASSGRVIKVIHGDRAYGNITLIQDDQAIRTMYAHQSRILVHPGEYVWVGQVIGRIGATGFATGPHLHFEIHVNRRPYDPAGWFGGTKRPVGCFSGLKY